MKNNNPISLDPLKKAYKNLCEYSDHIKDKQDETAVVKAFEYTYELSWKILKKVLGNQSIDCIGSKDVFRKAGTAGLIENVEQWLEFVELRNFTSHTYSDDLSVIALAPEEAADEVLKYVSVFKNKVHKLIISLEKNIE